jgi:SP family general alpha glucoside:H+ symporter-like MFS transporter
MTAIVGLLFILFFANSLAMLLAGEILCGLCWGVFQTITTAYASEVMPVVLRPYLTTYVNLCWVLGQVVATGVLRGMLGLGDSQWGWRIPYALQWMWPLPIIIGCIFAPEAPWWLVRHGKFEEAKKSLLRLTTTGVDPNFDVDKTVAMMEHTNELEKEISSGTSYFDCFKGTDLRRTEIVCMVWLVQTLCGSTFMGYSTVFYIQAGLPIDAAFSMSVGQFGLGACGTVASWFLMTWFGRRTIYLYGSCVLCLLLLIIGFLAIDSSSTSAQWAIGSMLLIFTFTYDFTVGPVCYSLVAELSSTRLKAKTIVLSRNLYNIGGIVVNVITNYQLTTTAWNWGAYSGFFWAGFCFLCVVWIFFRLPEPKNRTYGELDILFENKVSARKFKFTNVDIVSSITHAPHSGWILLTFEFSSVAILLQFWGMTAAMLELERLATSILRSPRLMDM